MNANLFCRRGVLAAFRKHRLGFRLTPSISITIILTLTFTRPSTVTPDVRAIEVWRKRKRREGAACSIINFFYRMLEVSRYERPWEGAAAGVVRRRPAPRREPICGRIRVVQSSLIVARGFDKSNPGNTCTCFLDTCTCIFLVILPRKKFHSFIYYFIVLFIYTKHEKRLQPTPPFAYIKPLRSEF